jgi:magnesium transporter
LQYPEDTAGGLMQTELIRVYVNNTVQQAIEEIRRQAEQKKGDLDIYELYVVNEQEQLVGHFSLENLVLSDPQTPVVDLIETDLFWVPVTLDQEEVADYFQRYNLVSLPVLDSDRKLLGRITVDDIVDVIEEEASEDIFQMAGVGGDDVAYDRIMRSAALRLPWLITNLFGGLLTGYLIWIFQVPLGEKLLVLLVAFVPVITGMGGNVGTQSASITVRGFALGRIELQNFSRYLIKEMRVGALMGLICGLTLSLIGWLWYGNAALGLVVGVALLVAMTIASSMGALLPAFFQKINIDPALASGPFVTTLNDVSGIIIYFTTAILFRSWLF